MNNTKIKLKMMEWSPVVLRIGLALVMLWFGSQQITNPTGWVAYLPSWIHILPLTPIQFIYMNGWFEVILGFLLLIGFFTRIIALLLVLHMAGIVMTVGYNEIGIRDFGILTGLFSLFLHGKTSHSVDSLMSKSTSL